LLLHFKLILFQFIYLLLLETNEMSFERQELSIDLPEMFADRKEMVIV